MKEYEEGGMNYGSDWCENIFVPKSQQLSGSKIGNRCDRPHCQPGREVLGMKLKYLVVGSGAIGGFFAASLSRAGKDVTMIARGENHKVIKENGLHIITPSGEYKMPVKVSSWEEYDEKPDIVLLCVKAYSLDSVIPELDKVCDEHTIIMPLINALDIGGELSEKMSVKCTALGGVVYVLLVREAPGRIRQNQTFCNLVAGMRCGEKPRTELSQIKRDFEETGADFIITENPLKAALRKFTRVSTLSGVTCYFDAPVGEVRSRPEGVQLFKDMCHELEAITAAMGEPFTEADEIPFPGKPVVEDSLCFFMSAKPEYQPSMKYDWDNHQPIEIKQQILDVIDLGRKYGVPTPAYEMVAEKLLRQGQSRGLLPL